jgi:hypothetical protein
MQYSQLLILGCSLILLAGCIEKNLSKTPETGKAKQLIDSILKVNKKLTKDNNLLTNELRECYKNSEGRDDGFRIFRPKIEYRDTCYKSLIYIEKGAKVRFKKSDNLQLVINYQSVIDSIKIQNAKMIKEKNDQVVARSRENLLLKYKLSDNQKNKSNWLLWLTVGFLFGCAFISAMLMIFNKLASKVFGR